LSVLLLVAGGGGAQQVITTSPPGLSLTVDGTNCVSPCRYQWVVGSTHTIGTTATQLIGGTRQYLFSGWSDGAGITHTILAPSSGTYTAGFLTQYYLTTSASQTGTGAVTPASGWYYPGAAVTVSATASSGYAFSGFSGDLTSATNPQRL